MTDLLKAQTDFSRMVSRLMFYIDGSGYLCTLGEAMRTHEQAELNAEHGTGIAHSLHCLSLAIDLHLYKADGTYLTDTKDYERVGVWWEGIGGTWGGRFTNPVDGNHFSLEFGGFK